jgi:hypothetical protein
MERKKNKHVNTKQSLAASQMHSSIIVHERYRK